MKLVIVSGYFNPLHKGHIEYINKAKELGNILVAIINNDKQVTLKKSVVFQDEDERQLIVSNLKSVDFTFICVDNKRSVSKTLRLIKEVFEDFDIIFTNGGDQKEGCLEEKICKELGIKVVYGLGNKIQSSSLLKK